MDKSTKDIKRDFIHAIGRRKESVSRVRLYPNTTPSWGESVVKKSEVFVNQKKAEDYFGADAVKAYTKPLLLTNTQDKFAITIKVQGGGKKGQLDATVLAIARALNIYDKEKFRAILKKEGMLTRDSRVRERRKVGMGGKSRRRKQSPKR